MRIVSWNVNGIRAVARKGLFAPMIKELDPDVLCLQETKAQQHESPVDLPEYHEYWNSAVKKGYSGTAIFTRVKPISVRLDIPHDIAKRFALEDGYGPLNQEGRVTVVELENFFVVSVYTPNAKGDLSRLEVRTEHWDSAFLAYVKQLETEKPVVFCGDLNVAHKPIDLARPKENERSAGYTQEERNSFERYIDAGFVDTFRIFNKESGQYTWWSNFGNARANNVGWRIDYIMSSKKLRNLFKEAHTHPNVQGSDHCPVSAQLEL